MIRDTVYEFIDDYALSRSAAIAYYTLFSLAPILVIAIAIAGFVFGEDAAQGALVGQLRGLMGEQGADLVQSMVKGASNPHAGIVATLIGVVTLLVTSTGVFSELQTDLNAIWKAEAPTTVTESVTAILKVRALGLGLVAAVGFLLIVSLLVSAVLAALAIYASRLFAGAGILVLVANFLVSYALIAAMFAVIYKVLPDKPLNWYEAIVGAIVTALLFTVGKALIGLYIGTSAIANSYGAAGTAIVLLLWIYYSAVIFLLGAEFTKVYARHRGNPEAPPPPAVAEAAPGRSER
jgi:membrane protein